MQDYPRITISGARGIVGRDLTVDNAQKMAWAYAKHIGGGKVIVGRDARPTGEMIKSAVVSGLLAGGAEVIDIGLAPTPTIGIMLRTLCGSDACGGDVHTSRGGIGITASHNPIEWNALKLFGPDGTFPNQAFVDEYIHLLRQGDFTHVEWNAVKPYRVDDDALDTHCRLVLDAVDTPVIQQAQFKVLVDGCRSVGGVFLPQLLGRLGCEVIRYDCEPDGRFTRGLEPVAAHLNEVCRAVKESEVHVGLVCDPDADRLAVISENGEAIGEEFTLALAVAAALQRTPGGTVVCNLSTSMLTEFAAQQNGARVVRTPIGEANVISGIVQHGAVIGGEGSGGVIYPAVHNGRDALTAAALVLQFMAKSGQTVSRLVSGFPNYVMLKDKIEMDLQQARTRLQAISQMNLGAQTDTRDGVRIQWPDAWLHLRCSNTEPIVRIFAESAGEANTRALIQKGHDLLKGRE